MINSPLITIILPVYNAEKTELINTINSVISQTYKNRELLAINDGSNNGIENFLTKNNFKDDRIKIINNDKNIGLTKTLNKGLSLSEGEYIARIDDEDEWIDNKKLEKQINFLENNVEYGVCGTNGIAIDKTGEFLFKLKWEEMDKKIRKTIMQKCPFLHVSVVFRKSCIDNVGQYDKKWDYTEDHELWLRIGKKYKLYNLQEDCVQFKMDPNGISGSHKIIQRWNIIKLGLLYKKDYPYTITQQLSNILNLIISIFPLKWIQFLMKVKNVFINKITNKYHML